MRWSSCPLMFVSFSPSLSVASESYSILGPNLRPGQAQSSAYSQQSIKKNAYTRPYGISGHSPLLKQAQVQLKQL